MPLPLLFDEHIPYAVIEGLRRRKIDVIVVQQTDLYSAEDLPIIEAAQKQQRIVYTRDADFIRHHARGIPHAGIFYHHPLAYSVGEAVRRVALACEIYALVEMENRLEFL